MKPLLIASLNLHTFKEWDERLPKILNLISSVRPDIIFTQETQRDPRFDTRNQIDILNETLNYPHVLFLRADTLTEKKGVTLPFPVEHGLGIMSNYPITKTILREIEQQGKEKKIIATHTIAIGEENCKITNLHLGNRDDWALSQFKQVLELTNGESHLIGDFNIHSFNFEKYKDLYSGNYISSYDYKKYISFPSENATFDYALILSSFSIDNVECLEEEVSDHRMLCIKISKRG